MYLIKEKKFNFQTFQSSFLNENILNYFTDKYF